MTVPSKSPSAQEAPAAQQQLQGSPRRAPAPGQALFHPESLSLRFLSDQFRHGLSGDEEPDPGERERAQLCFPLPVGYRTMSCARHKEEAAQTENASVPSPTFQFIQQFTYGRTKAPVCLTSPSSKPRTSLESNSLLSPSSELQDPKH